MPQSSTSSRISRAPEKARRLLRACLEKDPKQRLRDIGDAKRLLGEDAAAPAPSASRFGKWIGVAAALLAATAVALGFGLYRATRPAELKPLVRLDAYLGAGVSVESQGLALAPDGTLPFALFGLSGFGNFSFSHPLASGSRHRQGAVKALEAAN